MGRIKLTKEEREIENAVLRGEETLLKIISI